MLTAFNRVATLAQKSEHSNIDNSLLKELSEIDLYNKFIAVRTNVLEYICNKDYSKALDEFATLKQPVDNMFDSVMIMDKDEEIKNNRLALLRQIYDTMLTICDLSKIVYK
jgi:glycyl-tRNA synthetase beta chain